MAGQSYTQDEEISGINVTPLVDVVLVLLVIFMITAPALYQNAMKVQLPQAKSGEESTPSMLKIDMDAAGVISVDGKTVTLEELSAMAVAKKPQSAVLLADKKVEHGKVISIVDVLKQNGVQKFSFGVEKQ